MLLREAIEKCQGKTIRIGASTGFIYIGPADAKTVEVAAREERLKAENTLKKALEELTAIHDKAFLIRMQSVLTSSIRASIEKNERFESKLIDGAEEEIKKLKKLTPSEISKKATADFVSSRDRYIGQLLSSFAKATDYAERMSPWIAILERPVKEIYRSIDPATKGDVIIIIDGKEAGDYWFEEEYRRAHDSASVEFEYNDNDVSTLK